MEERERVRERKTARESESVDGVRDSPRATKMWRARSMRGLGRVSGRVASEWNRNRLRLRWRRREADCKPRSWKGKEGFHRGLG